EHAGRGQDPATGYGWIRNSAEGHENLGDLLETLHQAQGLYHVRDLAIDRGVEDSVAGANYRLVVVPGVPGKRYPWGHVVLGSLQIAVLAVHLIAHTDVEREVRPHRPRILSIDRRQGPGIGIDGAAKALLIEQGQAQGKVLQRTDHGRIHASKAARRRHLQTGAKNPPKQTA